MLSKTNFTLVGYGTEVRKPESGPQEAHPAGSAAGPPRHHVERPEAHRPARADERQPGQRPGRWGTCFGDSGGPSFLNGKLTTVTSYGYTSNCRYIGGYQRVDIPVVQDWLRAVGALPQN